MKSKLFIENNTIKDISNLLFKKFKNNILLENSRRKLAAYKMIYQNIISGQSTTIEGLEELYDTLTADNFEEIVAVVLYFKIKMLRQSLIRLGRKVGIKFVPVPANEKTIERRKREGKPTENLRILLK